MSNQLWGKRIFAGKAFVLCLLSTLMPFASAQQAPINGGVYQNGMQAGADQDEPNNIMILLDCSFSMEESLDGKDYHRERSNGSSQIEDKMALAKRTVLQVLQSVPPNVRVGLRVYGINDSFFTSCSSTSTLVPLGQNNRGLIADKIRGLHPTGATPISLSIMRSLHEDFQNVQGKRSIILISDGMETCGQDPCKLAVQMQQSGVDIKINVVGLGLHDYEAQKQLKCVAYGTKGKFYNATTAAELGNSLNSAMQSERNVHAAIVPQLPQSSPLPVNNPVSAPRTPVKPPYVDKLLPTAVPLNGKHR